jgi:hypothetical protein
MAFDLAKITTNHSIFKFTGEKIGEGSQGEVYNYTPSNDRVVKYSVIYDYYFTNTLDKKINSFFNILVDLKNNPENIFPIIFDFNALHWSKRQTIDGPQDYVIYYYIMNKLNKIDDDENKVFHSIMSHQDNNKKHNFTYKQLNDTLNGLSYGLNFDKQKITEFYFKVLSSKYHHGDITGRNIMKDYLNNFKLVDLDDLKKKEK